MDNTRTGKVPRDTRPETTLYLVSHEVVEYLSVFICLLLILPLPPHRPSSEDKLARSRSSFCRCVFLEYLIARSRLNRYSLLTFMRFSLLFFLLHVLYFIVNVYLVSKKKYTEHDQFSIFLKKNVTSIFNFCSMSCIWDLYIF